MTATPDTQAEGGAQPLLLCERVLRIAAQALGTDADHAVMVRPERTHPNPTTVDWPDWRACPWWPLRREGDYLLFEERRPQHGYGPRQLAISDYQVRRCLFVELLDLRLDWLAEHFPAPGAADYDWDQVAVVRWLRHHVDMAPERRRDHARRRGAQTPAPAAIASPPAPPEKAPTEWAFNFDPDAQPGRDARLRSLTARRNAVGWIVLAATLEIRGQRDLHATKVTIPLTAAQELSDVLAGVVRAKP